MKNNTFHVLTILTTSFFLLSACASTTQINSIPSGADLYLNGEKVGKTPYEYTDTKIVGSTIFVKMKKDGYEEFHTTFRRDEDVDVGAVIGGICVLFPFLWTMKYKPVHTYELAQASVSTSPRKTDQKSMEDDLDKLSRLKKLLDDGAITKEEYDAKKKVLLGI